MVGEVKLKAVLLDYTFELVLGHLLDLVLGQLDLLARFLSTAGIASSRTLLLLLLLFFLFVGLAVDHQARKLGPDLATVLIIFDGTDCLETLELIEIDVHGSVGYLDTKSLEGLAQLPQGLLDQWSIEVKGLALGLSLHTFEGPLELVVVVLADSLLDCLDLHSVIALWDVKAAASARLDAGHIDFNRPGPTPRCSSTLFRH